MEVTIQDITFANDYENWTTTFTMDLLIDGENIEMDQTYKLHKNNKVILKYKSILDKLYHKFAVNNIDGRDVLNIYSIEPKVVVRDLKGKTLTIGGA